MIGSRVKFFAAAFFMHCLLPMWPCLTPPAGADSLLYDYREKVPVIQKRKRNTPHAFENRRNPGTSGPPGRSAQSGEELPLPVYLFSVPRSTREQTPGAGSYDGLPACRGSNERRTPIFSGDRRLANIDLVVYQIGDQRQDARARGSVHRTIPYIEGALVNPFRDRSDHSQALIRMLGIECLPSRVRSAIHDGSRFLEYREGDAAWK